uniref:Uncharacterized protein n=1 Tax=Amphimedon queenslandica TaxID=400682 RepID=A0A1X7UDF9_AMPQE
MAGLGESCSHVASFLWAIEAGVQLRDSLTVTHKAYRVLPNSKKDVPYAPVEQIKFQGKIRARSTWKAAHHIPSVVEQSSSTTYSSSKLSISPDVTSLPCSSSLTPPHPNVSATLSQSHNFSTGLASLPPPKQPSQNINPPTDAEIQKLYSLLAKCKSKPAILSLTKDYLS